MLLNYYGRVESYMPINIYSMLNRAAAQTSDIFSLFIIALAIAAAAWVIICKKPPRGGL
jgi:uncharacterized protein (DUF1778 family)